MNYSGYNNGNSGIAPHSHQQHAQQGTNKQQPQQQPQQLTRNYNGLSVMSQPTLMASSAILTIGPYKHRKDLTRESVLSKYQILGYIAAGTYGKVYKAKSRRIQEKDGDTNEESMNSSIDVKPGGSQLQDQQQKRNLPAQLGLSKSLHQSHDPSQQDGLTRPNQNSRNDSMSDMANTTTYNKNTWSGKHETSINVSGSQNVEQAHDQDQLNQDSSKVAGSLEGKRSSNTNATPVVTEQLFAIKKFKNDSHQSSKSYNHDINGHEILHYTGISQSAIREMSICRELSNKNITKTIDILLEDKSIYIVSEFCEHDLLQIIHFHSHPEIRPIQEKTVKSFIWQILNGVLFLHKNWIFHRDLKPANIMVTANGIVKIGDLGLARKFNNPLQSLYTGDKVVVTIWYRAPELLLGSRNYSPTVDLWAVGCILAELLSLRPIFKGEETKIDINNKKSVPFQSNQFQKIVEILGTPTLENWPSLSRYPEYASFKQQIPSNYSPNLANWYKAIGGKNKSCLELLQGLLTYDPLERLTAENSLLHHYFLETPKVTEYAFEGLTFKYPKRRIYTDDNDIKTGSNAGKRHGYDNNKIRKRQR